MEKKIFPDEEAHHLGHGKEAWGVWGSLSQDTVVEVALELEMEMEKEPLDIKPMMQEIEE